MTAVKRKGAAFRAPQEMPARALVHMPLDEWLNAHHTKAITEVANKLRSRERGVATTLAATPLTASLAHAE